MLDEPFGALDAAIRRDLRRWLREVHDATGSTTIFVTHDQEEANTTSDRMAVLDKGVIQQIGTPQHLYDHPANSFVAGFLGTANILKGGMQGADFVSAAGQRLPVATAVEAATRIVLRPQNIRIAGGGGEIPGKVTHREFLGSQIRYLVETPDGQIIVDTLHSSGPPPYDEGAPVSLSIDSSSAPLLTD